MSSEAITRNDLKAVLDEVLPAEPSEYRKLLWTNPSPTSAFSAQTVTLDLSSYDDVEIEMAGVGTYASTTTQTFKLEVNIGGLLSISANNIWWRYVTPRTTGVEFGAGYRTTTYGSNATLDNDQMVPRKIYGIKYERVAPPQMEVPMVAYNENFVGSSGTINKTHTIADNGLYLILARANAYNGSAVPAIRLFVNDVRFTQNADAGGSTMTYLIATLSAGDVIKAEFLATNSGAEGDWNNLAIIRLGSTS